MKTNKMVTRITSILLTLISSQFSLAASPEIKTTASGTQGSFQNKGNTVAKLIDNSLTTFFDAPTPNGNYAQFDLGETSKIDSISYAPRAGFNARMTNGLFVASNDSTFATFTTLATIATQPPSNAYASLPITNAGLFRYVRYVAPAGSYGNAAEIKIYGSPAAVPASQVAPIPSNLAKLYADPTNRTQSDGKTPATAFPTVRVTNASALLLKSASIFQGVAVLSSHSNAWVGGDPALPLPTLRQLQVGSSSPYVTTWWNDSKDITLANMVIDSQNACGTAGAVRGTNITIANVELKDLLEGFDYSGVNGLTITGGKQTGKVAGRCHYFLDVTNLTWKGGTYGPASKQSPVRMTPPGIKGGTIDGVVVTQKDSPFPIATWAIHAMHNVKVTNCSGIAADFSIGDTAGDGVGDEVADCSFDDLTVTDARLYIASVARRLTFTRGTVSNSLGWGVSIKCPMSSKNVVDGMVIYSNAGFNFISASDLVVKNCTLYTHNKNGVMFSGTFTNANDGGNNKVVQLP